MSSILKVAIVTLGAIWLANNVPFVTNIVGRRVPTGPLP